MGFKSSYSRLARLFKKSRDEWRAKAIARQKENRLLKLKIRDLELSRARWKEKAKAAAAKAQEPPMDKAGKEKQAEQARERDGEQETGTSLAEVSPSTPPIEHHYPVSTLQLSVRTQVECLWKGG
ncbi:MAG: hypothetical protein N838_24090 [Thiohalocapsa sp. PB-PSB1]|jgi:chromosome segregation ATPase|nr:MAG: hypothetical protein N838_32055 [Thiohalocapsa sp. PB-PSB1]QQO55968.1 MAG: hypothetical protein N838_24090 [Thiohalocapsa sp. PB-PSB1]HCS90144.1 hypothetical protein [Chromatiaceae bacterium]